MPDPAPLLAAIASNPDDDLPRLVYADWLDEHGDQSDQDRALFIRLQCHTARVGPLDPSWAPAKLREYDLFKTNEARWRPGRRDDVSFMLMANWSRGFPACIDLADVADGHLTSGEWCNGAFHWSADPSEQFGPWPTVGPVREVRFSDWGPGSGSILRTEQLRTVRSLSLMEWYAGVNPNSIENFAGELAQLTPDHFPEFTALDLRQGELNLPALERLAEVPTLGRLTRLSLRYPPDIPVGEVTAWRTAAQRLFEAVAPRLEQLTLHALTPELIATFAVVRWPRLRSLSVYHTRGHGLGQYDAADTPRLEALGLVHLRAPRAQPVPVVANPLAALGGGWPDCNTLKVLSLGSVSADALVRHLEDTSRACPNARLEYLSALVERHNGLPFQLRNFAEYPRTRALRGSAGSYTNADLAPLTDPTVLPELHTVWSDEPEPLTNLPWRGGTRTVVPRGTLGPAIPTRREWCNWFDDLIG